MNDSHKMLFVAFERLGNKMSEESFRKFTDSDKKRVFDAIPKPINHQTLNNARWSINFSSSKPRLQSYLWKIDRKIPELCQVLTTKKYIYLNKYIYLLWNLFFKCMKIIRDALRCFST